MNRSKLNKRIETYLTKFKDDIKKKVLDSNLEGSEKNNALIEYVYNYDRLVLNTEEFSKPKRVQNSLPSLNRCNAKRASGEQCTRKRKENCEYCGTHTKGTPHGVIILDDEKSLECNKVRSEVVAEDINGIVYYIDQYQNVYKTEDVLNEKENPQIIAKWEKNAAGRYTIPEFGLV